jgi:putative transposase
MPRFPRLVHPGIPVHIVARGNYRQQVFGSDSDRSKYLSLLEDHAAEHKLTILGWCLMSNHVHLIAIPHNADSLAKVLQRVQGEFAAYTNYRNKRPSGHLWQSRFYSCLLEGDYLWTALRYVELNPVRAGLSARAQESNWSSARYHCSLAFAPKLLSMERWAACWTPNRWHDTLLYGRYEREVESIRHATGAGLALGSAEFLKEFEERSRRRLVRKPVGRPRVLAAIAAARA